MEDSMGGGVCHVKKTPRKVPCVLICKNSVFYGRYCKILRFTVFYSQIQYFGVKYSKIQYFTVFSAVQNTVFYSIFCKTQ